jgi:type VI secretion system protein ImpC
MSGQGFEYQFGKSGQTSGARRRDPDDPRKILLLADLRGREFRESGAESLDQRQPLRVDVDNFDSLLAQLAPALELSAPGESGASIQIAISELDDFHPDQLLRSVATLEPLRAARKMVLDNASADAVRRKLQETPFFRVADLAAESAPSSEPDEEPGTSATAKSDEVGSTLERLLGRETAPDRTPPAVDISRLIEDAVKPYIVPSESSELADARRMVDGARTSALRCLLHQTAFQALEATWRSIRRIVSQLESDDEVQIFLFDVTRTELLADLGAASEWRNTRLFRAIGESHHAPWSLLAVDVTFPSQPQELVALAMLGGIAAESGSSVVAGTDGSLVGCQSFVEQLEPREWVTPGGENLDFWMQLRKSELAPCIGLAAPRVIARMPYGSETDPIDSFDFEELETLRPHESFLWSGPAWACAELASRAWTAGGDLNTQLDLEDLPVFSFTENGEKQMQACAEGFLSERAGSALLAAGIMPLLSYRNRDAVRLARWQSIAEPAKPLAIR